MSPFVDTQTIEPPFFDEEGSLSGVWGGGETCQPPHLNYVAAWEARNDRPLQHHV